jgi:hypothetical protein
LIVRLDQHRRNAIRVNASRLLALISQFMRRDHAGADRFEDRRRGEQVRLNVVYGENPRWRFRIIVGALSGGRDARPSWRFKDRREHAPQVIDLDRLEQNRRGALSLGEMKERRRLHLSHQDHRNLDIELAEAVENAKRAEARELGLRNDEASARARVGQPLLELDEQRWPVGVFHDIVAVVPERGGDACAELVVGFGEMNLGW